MFSTSSYAWLPLRLHNEIPQKRHRGPVTLFKHNEPSKSDSFKTRCAEVLGGSSGGQIINTKTKGIAVLPSSWPIPFSSSQQHTQPMAELIWKLCHNRQPWLLPSMWQFLCPYLSASICPALRSEFASWALLWLQVPVPICLWSFAQKVHHFVTDKKYSIGASNKLQLLLKSVQITGLLILRLLDPQNL
jgi:hypothetical protein